MILIKANAGVSCSAIFLFAYGWGQQVVAAEATTAPAASPAGMQSPRAGALQMTPEQRSAALAAAQAKSASTAFNTTPLVDPNTATRERLAAIPGMTEARVQAVMARRPFSTPTALHAVIGEAMSAEERFRVYSAMFVKVNLNTASRADFELVPSTMSSARLAREFEEYRPYKTMAEFRREMRKYVSEKEVEFLERFVTID